MSKGNTSGPKRKQHAVSDRRKWTRYSINCKARATIRPRNGSEVSWTQSGTCAVVNISRSGAQVYLMEGWNDAIVSCKSEELNEIVVKCYPEDIAGMVRWKDGGRLGLMFKYEQESVPHIAPRSSWHRFKHWLVHSQGLQAIEIAVAIVGLIYIAWQAKEIRRQSEMQYTELKISRVATIEDSERFINKLLVEHPELAVNLFREQSKDKAQKRMLGYIFLQEWEKMFRLREELQRTSAEKEINNFWNYYSKIVERMVKQDFIRDIVTEPGAMDGMNPKYVTWLNGKVHDKDRRIYVWNNAADKSGSRLVRSGLQ